LNDDADKLDNTNNTPVQDSTTDYRMTVSWCGSWP